jgi:AbrB family looped-hinge helix DNA binding protein
MEKVKVDTKGRIMIPSNVRERMKIREGTEVNIIPKEDYIILCKSSTVTEFKNAADRLAQQIAKSGRRINIQKLF